MTLPTPERWAVLSTPLDELLELPAALRPARLAQWQGRDPEIARELAALLAASQQAQVQGFLDGAAPGPDTPHTLPGAPEPATLAGQRLGPYVLQAPLGQGGSGTVWAARRSDGRFEGQVAVKLLHLSLLGRAGAERFQREGHILARLAHPHIARLLDAGVTEAGQPYLVMDLVQGQRLDQHCAALRLGVPERLKLFADVLAAVAHAHSHGVIHRDIKPSNIMVDAAGVVKLLDFGIAKIVQGDETAAESTDLTRDWGRAMTPQYAAPEQLRGEPVTTATDVFALGVLLYELLAGELPFGRLRPPSMAQAQAMAMADAMLPPKRPSAVVASAALRRQLAGDLDTIALRALKPAPAERYPTVSAMADDLARHQSGHPVLARADSLLYRVRKFVGRHKAASAVAAGVALAAVGGAHAQVAVLLALAAGTLLALWQARVAQGQAALAKAALRQAEEVKQFIASIFTEATPREGAGGVVTAQDLLASALGRIEAELAANPAVAAELGVLVARSCSQLGDVALGARALEAAVPRCQRALGPAHALTLQGQVLQIEAFNGCGSHAQAQAVAARVLPVLRQQLPAQALLLVDALRGLSFLMAKRQDEAGSFAPLQEAVAVAEQHLGPTHAETVYTLGFLSNTYSHFGHNGQALQAAERALQRCRQALGPQRPHTLLTAQERWYADALVRVGRPADAEPIARQVVLDQRLLDTHLTSRVVNAMTAHSVALLAMGRVDEAAALAQDVVAQHSALKPGANMDAGYFAERLAQCLVALRRPQVQAELDRAAALWQQRGDEAVPTRLRRHRIGALAAAWRGDVAGVQALVAAVETLAQDELPVEWARLQRAVALVLRLQAQGTAERAAALAAAVEALARCAATPALAVDHGHAHTELGLLWLDAGDAALARHHLDEAARHYDAGQVQMSALRSDAHLGLGRLLLADGQVAAARQHFVACEQVWARSQPGSVWHAQCQHWLAQADAGAAPRLEAAAHPVLAASTLAALRALAAAAG